MTDTDLNAVAPDAPPKDDLPPKTHNIDPYSESKDRVEALTAMANRWISEVEEISDDEQAGRAAEFKAQLRAAKKTAEDIRKQTNAPLQDEITANNTKFSGLKGLLDVAIEKLDALLLPFLNKKRKEKEEREAQARVEIESKQREAERLAREAETNKEQAVETAVAAVEAQSEADKAAAVLERLQKQRAQVKGDHSTKSTGIRKTWYAEITDIDKAFNHYKDKPAVAEMLTKLGSADARGGRRRIPGFKIDYKETVT